VSVRLRRNGRHSRGQLCVLSLSQSGSVLEIFLFNHLWNEEQVKYLSYAEQSPSQKPDQTTYRLTQIKAMNTSKSKKPETPQQICHSCVSHGGQSSRTPSRSNSTIDDPADAFFSFQITYSNSQFIEVRFLILVLVSRGVVSRDVPGYVSTVGALFPTTYYLLPITNIVHIVPKFGV
jgi:hypothetical protein